MQSAFLERLGRGTILCDGAMGMMLYPRDIPFARCFDELNLSQPTLAPDIQLHQTPCRARGAMVSFAPQFSL